MMAHAANISKRCNTAKKSKRKTRREVRRPLSPRRDLLGGGARDALLVPQQCAVVQLARDHVVLRDEGDRFAALAQLRNIRTARKSSHNDVT